MKIKKHTFNRYKLIFFFIILAIILVGSISYFRTLPPPDKKDTLQILQLRHDITPIFKIESGLTYTQNLTSQIQQSLEGDGSPNESLESLVSLAPLTEPLGEPSPNADVINLFITIEDSDSNTSDIMTDLSLLSNYALQLKVSLIPGQHIVEEKYISICSSLSSWAKGQNLSNIDFIWYPQDTSKLKAYDKDSIANIGIVISSMKDFDKLAPIYNYFNSKKELYVQENIGLTLNNDIMLATKHINAAYYTLAIDFPGINTIFSPYIESPFEVENTFSINERTPNYKTYDTIYNRLFSNSWLTTKNVQLNSDSPYAPVNSYTSFSGEVELLLSSDSAILPNLPGKVKTSSSAQYIRYRWNETPMDIQLYYPYLLKFDTTQYPNGVNRLKALAYDNNNDLVEVQSIDLLVNNPISNIRTPRLEVPYSVGTVPIYESSYIPILMYHSITDTVSKENENSCVETSLFEAQIKSLLDNGYTPINFKDLSDYLDGNRSLPEKPILITMDDGYLNNYTNAYPIYKKYNVQATLFVSPYYMQEDNTERHFGWRAAQEMEDSGLIDIQSHGYDHTPLSSLSLKDIRYQVTRSKGLIEHHLGSRDVTVVAYPQFRNTSSTRKLLTTLDIDFQITTLAKRGTVLNSSGLKRINVPNTMSPDLLITTLEDITQ